MRCPKCKKGRMAYHPDHSYTSCTHCDYRNGHVSFIHKVRKHKTYRQEFLSITRSPMNKLIWFLELKCGHAKWITRKSRPQGKAYPCQMCRKIDEGLTGD